MTVRKKLPAFARALVENRRRGFHPLNVSLLYGDNWRTASVLAKSERTAVQIKRMLPYTPEWIAQVGEPMLAIEPRDYAPGMYDFACVAGVAVRVIDALDAYSDADRTAKRWGVFYDLLAELADFAAFVDVTSIGMDLSTIAWEHRVYEAGRYAWPRWWSDERQREYDGRNIIWLGDCERAVHGQLAAV